MGVIKEGVLNRGWFYNWNAYGTSHTRPHTHSPMRPDASVESDKNIPSPVPMDVSIVTR